MKQSTALLLHVAPLVQYTLTEQHCMKYYKRYLTNHRETFKSLGILSFLEHAVGILDRLAAAKDVLFSSENASNPLFNHSNGRAFIKHYYGYVGHFADHTSGDIGYGLLHYSMIRALKPERVLCIGSQQGFIPALCALACKDNAYGHVEFVDPGKAEADENDWGGKGFWLQPEAQNHFKMFDLSNWITLHTLTSAEYAKKHKKDVYEYIYIDGDHSYKGSRFDYKTFWPRLTHGGIMSFHDITTTGMNNGTEFGVWKLWQEVSKKHGMTFTKGGSNNAVGFLQKPFS